MCGIAGILAAAGRQPERAQLRRMSRAIAHRGPDGEGEWLDPEAGIALAHRRLAIIDVSAAGAQPMHSASGRWVLTYNGEIYNYRALRAQLEREGAAPAWRGHSDTEVLLAAIEAWGVERAIAQANGMFALALWDRSERALHLMRDRLGEKPLYVATFAAGLAFASDLAALRCLPGFDDALDRDAVSHLLRYGFVSAPRSIARGAFAMPAAGVLTVRAGDLVGADLRGLEARVRRYWSVPASPATRGGETPTIEDSLGTLDELLGDAVRLRMESDVPTGAYLSGGVDSSLVVALMQAGSARRVRTFSIGFHEARLDEAGHAARVAAALGTEHRQLYVDDSAARDLVPSLSQVYSEPFADASQLPALALAQLVRREVTVALSGDGGDELFAGYGQYRTALKLLSVRGVLPRERAGGAGAGARDHRVDDAEWRARVAGGRVRRGLYRLGASDPESMLRRMRELWPGAHHCLQPDRESTHAFAPDRPLASGRLARLQRTDIEWWLPDDILVKVDRASMSVAQEVRPPMLDHRVVEFALGLPESHLDVAGGGKRVLKLLLARYVDPTLWRRPKQGFDPPLARWLRGPLRGWAEHLLDPAQLRSQDVLDAPRTRALWQSLLDGNDVVVRSVWAVLMLRAWIEDSARRRDLAA